jgi:hypothetical protein
LGFVVRDLVHEMPGELVGLLDQGAQVVAVILITVAILAVLKGAAVDIYRRLMDAVDPELVDPELVDLVEASLRVVPGVVDVEELRLRWIGHRVRAETGITVDANLGIVAAHDIATATKHTVLHEVPKLLGAATVHVSPRDSTGHDHHAVLAHHPTTPPTSGGAIRRRIASWVNQTDNTSRVTPLACAERISVRLSP